MLRISLWLATIVAALGMALASQATAQAEVPGTPCGTDMVVNTHDQCIKIGTFCSFSDGMIIGTLGPDGRCVIPGTNIRLELLR
jgi:hypothetical protein